MSSIAEEIRELRAAVSGLGAIIAGVNPESQYPLTGNVVRYGCAVTEGTSATDMYLALDGTVDHVNPSVVASPYLFYHYPNLAYIGGYGFIMADQNVSDQSNISLLVDDAPGAGYSRFDLVYIGINGSGPCVKIATGTPTAVDISTHLTDALGYTHDPVSQVPINAIVLARVYVEAEVTGIANAKIYDLRKFLNHTQSVSAAYTAVSSDAHIVCTTGSFTVTVPSSTLRFTDLQISNVGTGTITIGATVNGTTGNTLSQWDSATLKPIPGGGYILG